MTVLTLVPTTREIDALVAAFNDMDVAGQPITIGRLNATSYLGGRALVAEGGLGKAQFAVQTQHSVEAIPDLSVALCLGSAGGLNSELNIGDVVVATETIEHDFNRGLIPGPLPEFEGDARFISAVRDSRSFDELPFAVKFGRVASGDEAIMTTTRAAEVTNATGAIAVAWEGAGGARACRFAEVPFVEVRGISDMANEEAESAFFENIPATMKNLAMFLNEFVTLMPSS